MTDPATDPLENFPIVIDFPVAWGDMDAFGHVNNTKYFRWFEDGRIAYFAEMHLEEAMKATGIGGILGHTECRFRIPLTFPDSVRIGASVTDLQGDYMVMSYVVVSQWHGKIAAEGSARIVAFDYAAGRKATWPDQIVQRVKEIQA